MSTDSIVDKLTPPAPVDETSAPGTTMSPDGVAVAGILVNALRDHGIVITPDQLASKPAPVPTPNPAKPLLTSEEATLLGRCQTFAKAALGRHGISLGANESKWIGAEVADFVLREQGHAVKVPAPLIQDDIPSPASAGRRIG